MSTTEKPEVTGRELDDLTIVFRPFDSAESEVLRSFVADVRRLGEMSFFQQVPRNAKWSWDAETRYVTTEMDEPNDEAVRAAITLFRQLYTPSEPHSFARAMNVLKDSIHEHDGPLRDRSLALIRGHTKSAKNALAADGMGMVLGDPDHQQPVATKTIIDAYMHGYYLHTGNEKSALAKQLDEMQPFPRFTLYTVMLTLRNVYWNAANAVDRVLAVPELLDAD